MPVDSIDADRICPGSGKGQDSLTVVSQHGKTYSTAREAVAELERQHGKQSAMWIYHNAVGDPVGVVVRWNLADGKRYILPVSWHGDGWIIGDMPESRPLYCLPDLAGADQVYVTEGEKAADAARSIGLTATTSVHGAQSPDKTNWNPLAGRQVVILPNHDSAGRAYADAVVMILGRLMPTPTIKVITLLDLPDHGDINDWLEQHDAHDPAELKSMIEALANAADPIDQDTMAFRSVPVLVKLADVQPEPIHWLWPGRIALGKLTLLIGDPGLGKSLLTLDIASRVSTGTPWPDALSGSNSAGGVVLLSAEDDVSDTIRPRLDAAGADVSRVVALTAIRNWDDGRDYTRAIDLSRDLHHVEAAINSVVDCRLVVIDPLTAYLGQMDSHKNAEIRGLLAPLAELSGRRRVAVLAVTHLRKSGGPAVYRSMGSLAFAAAARAVWAVAKDKGNPARRLLLSVKNNLGHDYFGLAYSVESNGENGDPIVMWESDPVEISADDALATDRTEDEHDDAEEWLREALADGEMPAAEVLKEGRSNGYTDKAIRKAFKAIGAGRRREGFGSGGTWYWSLPTTIDIPASHIGAIDSHTQKEDNNANNGQEWGEF
jgi:archaellum biogenesis ATPase FlaH